MVIGAADGVTTLDLMRSRRLHDAVPRQASATTTKVQPPFDLYSGSPSHFDIARLDSGIPTSGLLAWGSGSATQPKSGTRVFVSYSQQSWSPRPERSPFPGDPEAWAQRRTRVVDPESPLLTATSARSGLAKRRRPRPRQYPFSNGGATIWRPIRPLDAAASDSLGHELVVGVVTALSW